MNVGALLSRAHSVWKAGFCMEHEQAEQAMARRSALIYLSISLCAALLFFLAASLTSGYPAVARLGGAIWVWLLSLIVSMPLVTSRVKRQRRSKG